MSRFGPNDATLKLLCVGPCITAETAEKRPAIPHVMALTRPTEMPQRRAASGLLAAARICLPVLDERMNSARAMTRSEEHTSELQSRQYLVCRLLLEKK